jgi:glycosyltransferase involved in cell wall biosynthesis
MIFSVLISVYSKESPAYFNEAFQSIWVQQTLKPDQIVLVKDGPLTPELDDEIARWQEELGDLLTVVRLPTNVGLGAALNAGLPHCRFDLVARMDTDDISLPDRFEKQVAFMQTNPDVVASSAFIEEFDETGQGVFVRRLPEGHKEILRFSKKRCPLSHPVVMYRRDAVLAVGGYPPFFPEDSALWSLLIVRGYRLTNIPDVLLRMRTSRDFIHRRGLAFLKGEIKLLGYQKRIGFLTLPQYWMNLAIRIGIRLPPAFVRRWLYKVAR